MFVSDRGWVHNCLEARGHDIFLLSTPQTLSGLLPLPHTRSTQLKNISQSSHALPFFLLLYHVLGKWFQSVKFNIDKKCCVKCLQMPFSTHCKSYQMPGTILRETAHQCAWTECCSICSPPLTQKMENSGQTFSVIMLGKQTSWFCLT